MKCSWWIGMFIFWLKSFGHAKYRYKTEKFEIETGEKHYGDECEVHFEEAYLNNRRDPSQVQAMTEQEKKLSKAILEQWYPYNFHTEDYETLWNDVEIEKFQLPLAPEGMKKGSTKKRPGNSTAIKISKAEEKRRKRAERLLLGHWMEQDVVNSSWFGPLQPIQPPSISHWRHPAWQERPPKVAFLLSVHNQHSIRGVLNLLSTIYNTYDLFVFHIDQKVEWCVQRQLRRTLQRVGDNFFFCQKNLDVQWATFSIVEMTLELIKTAVRIGQGARDTGHPQFDWDFAINLCGNSRALTSTGYRQFLLSQLSPDTNFFGNFTRIGKRSNSFYYRTPARCKPSRRMCKYMTNTPKNNLVYKGGQWFILSRNFSKYLHDDNNLVPAWIDFFSKTNFADESFFQSVILSSPFKNSVTLSLTDKIHRFKILNPVYTSWINPCLHSAYHHYPCILGVEDINFFTGVKRTDLSHPVDNEGYFLGAIFIRKIQVNSLLDNLILDMLDPLEP